jgi:hypothetical protein
VPLFKPNKNAFYLWDFLQNPINKRRLIFLTGVKNLKLPIRKNQEATSSCPLPPDGEFLFIFSGSSLYMVN